VWVTAGGSRHVYEPALSGKGLGSSQSASVYLSQVDLHPQDLLVLCATFPRDWAADLLNERPLASLDASYRKLVFAKGDLNAVLVQAQSGHGLITLLRPDVPTRPLQAIVAPIAPTMEMEEVAALQKPEPQKHAEHGEPISTDETPITEEQLDRLADFAAHMVQPSAYAIPPQPEGAIPLPKQEEKPNGAHGFPASIPRATPVEPEPPSEETLEIENRHALEEEVIPLAPAKKNTLQA
jgi:hypothetical protein